MSSPSGDITQSVAGKILAIQEWAGAIRKALLLYASPEALAHFRLNGMSADHSWDQAAQNYLAMYEDVLHGP